MKDINKKPNIGLLKYLFLFVVFSVGYFILSLILYTIPYFGWEIVTGKEMPELIAIDVVLVIVIVLVSFFTLKNKYHVKSIKFQQLKFIKAPKKKHSLLLIVLIPLIFVIIMNIFFLNEKIVGGIQIVGDSMEPNYHKDQLVFLYEIPKYENIKRGDIILFPSPRDRNKELIKRVIGKSGDSISLIGGYVFLDKSPLVEPYIKKQGETWGFNEENKGYLMNDKIIKIPKNKYFVLGDNREHSGDSRDFGLVDYSSITGYISLEKQANFIKRN